MSDNEDLYNQAIDDDGNTIEDVKAAQQQMSPYEKEYNEVISSMSQVCRHVVWNNEPENKDKRVKIDEDGIGELCNRIWALSNEFD